MWENPALNPTREWEDTPEIRIELGLIVKAHAEEASVLHELLSGPIRDMTAEDRRHAAFLNQVAQAFGFVDLVRVDGNSGDLTGGVREPLAAVLDPGAR